MKESSLDSANEQGLDQNGEDGEEGGDGGHKDA